MGGLERIPAESETPAAERPGKGFAEFASDIRAMGDLQTALALLVYEKQHPEVTINLRDIRGGNDPAVRNEALFWWTTGSGTKAMTKENGNENNSLADRLRDFIQDAVQDPLRAEERIDVTDEGQLKALLELLTKRPPETVH